MSKLKQRYCKECKVPVLKGKQYCSEHINRWHRPSTTHFKCKECNVTKPKRLFATGHNTCKSCGSTIHNSKSKVFTYLGKELTNLLVKYKTSKQHQEKAIKVKIPQHKLHIREVKRELAEFEKRVDKERRAIVYRYRQAEGKIQVNERTIKNRKMRWKEWEKDIAQHIVNNFPPSDYSNKYDWTKSMFDVTKLISKQYNIKISVLKKHINDIFGYKGTESAWIKHIDNKIKKIQPNYTGKAPWILECINVQLIAGQQFFCGIQQEKPNRVSLVRALGLGGNNDKKNGGYCEKCANGNTREGWTLSEQDANNCRLTAYNYSHHTNYTSVDEIPYGSKSYKSYSNSCRAISKTVLKRHNPKEYERYINNKYDGTDLNQLSIDHIKPLYKCFDEEASPKVACDISNLQVITMRENILKEQPQTIFNDKKG
jgi:hypothetical protein